jgi:hypothetical protein
MLLPLVALSLLALQEVEAPPKLPPSTFPIKEEAFAEFVGIRKVQRLELPGVELWCDDPKLFKVLETQIPKSHAWAVAALGGMHLPEGAILRLILLSDDDAVRTLVPLVAAEAKRWEVPAPPASFFNAVAKSGSGLWTFPPFSIVHTKALRDPKRESVSRAVHDMAALMADFSVSRMGFGVPEFIEEGFAGMVLRRSVKKPVPLVSHDKTALKSRIMGWGVFAGISSTNDASNDPIVWPVLMRNAVKKMRKNRNANGMDALPALLRRSAEDFARTDYAYSWAVNEFLFDPKAMTPTAQTRREATQSAFAHLRDPKMTMLDIKVRGEKLLTLLLAATGEDEVALHGAFLDWSEERLPRK